MAANGTAVARPKNIIATLQSDTIQKRIKEVLGERAPQFCASVVSLTNASDTLRQAEPNSIIAACMTAALLNLPVSKDLGFAHIIPYAGVAQFQMGYKGFVQLAMRTGQYRHLNACPVYEGELVKYDRLTGELIIDEKQRKGDVVIGWAAYMELINGFSHALYWTDAEVQKHAEKYSQAVKKQKKDSPWYTNPTAMKLKTVLKALLSKWGILSVELERALHEDQGVRRTIDSDVEYLDNGKAAEKPPIELPPSREANHPEVAKLTIETPEQTLEFLRNEIEAARSKE
jgi:recombination protein RecT